MNPSLEKMLSLLPSGENLARDLNISEAHALGVGYSGDEHKGYEIHKLLSSEGVMFSYLRKGDKLEFWYKEKLRH